MLGNNTEFPLLLTSLFAIVILLGLVLVIYAIGSALFECYKDFKYDNAIYKKERKEDKSK